MTKIEITAAMVERAKMVLVDGGLLSHGETVESHARRILSAALNPPPEPEIEVTKEMLSAAANAYNRYTYEHHSAVTVPLTFGAIAAAYRAMRALEPKPDAAHDDGTVFTSRGPAHMHRRSDDTSRDTYFHRRAGDPK